MCACCFPPWWLRFTKLCLRQLLPGRLDWLGNEHPRTYEDVVRFKYLLSSLSALVIVLWQGDCETMLRSCLRSLFFFLRDCCWVLLSWENWQGHKSVLLTLIFKVNRGMVAQKMRFGFGLILFSTDCCTADRVGCSASCYVETAPLANQRPRDAVSALFCMWPELWLVHKRKSFA